MDNKIDVLYILGSGSNWGNNELKYSLRSLEKFATGINRVFVTGEDPGFLSDSVIYNYQPDPGFRAYNHIHKVLWTFENTDISDNALLNYDDNFFIQPVDITNYPYYFKGMLPNRVTKNRGYKISLYNAYKILKQHSKSITNFSVHCPVIYNRQDFLGLKNIWDMAKTMDHAFVVRAVYCNMLGITGKYMSDCKIKNTVGKEAILEVLKGRHIFSIHDKAINKGVSEILEEMFPDKSRWEK